MWLWNQDRCGRSRRQIEHGQRYLNWALTHKNNGLVPIVTATRNVYPDAVGIQHVGPPDQPRQDGRVAQLHFELSMVLTVWRNYTLFWN